MTASSLSAPIAVKVIILKTGGKQMRKSDFISIAMMGLVSSLLSVVPIGFAENRDGIPRGTRRRRMSERHSGTHAASARSGGPRTEPVGEGHRQTIGQDDRERRAAWLSLSSGAAEPRPGGRG